MGTDRACNHVVLRARHVSVFSSAVMLLAVALLWSPARASAVAITTAAPADPVQVVGSAPGADARVGAMPGTVSVQFNQPMRAATLHVVGPHGTRVDLDGTTVTSQGGRAVAVTAQNGGTGGYLVAWSATPAAGGPSASGALAFAVGRVPAWSTSGVAQFLSAGGAGSGLAAAVAVLEAVDLLALLALAGLAVMLALARRRLPAGRGAYNALSALLALVAVATAGGLVLHGPFAAGLPAGDALARSMVRATLHSAWGVGALLALGGVVLLGAVGAPLALRPAGGATDGAGEAGRAAGEPTDKAGEAGRPARRWPSSRADRLALVGSAVLVAAMVAQGHSLGEAAAAAWTALVVVHVASAVVLAGLLVIRGTASRRKEVGNGAAFDPRLLRATTLVLAATGLVLAAHDIGALSAVTGTAYGRFLITKAAAMVALLVCVYAVARPPTRGARKTPSRQPRRVPVATEASREGGGIDPLALAAVLFVVIAFVTALLVFQTPGRIAAPRSDTGTLASSQMYLEYQLGPARAGANNVHLYVLDGASAPMSVAGATAELVWPSERGAPLPIPLSNAGPGHYLEYNLEIPLAGTWTLKVAIFDPDTGMPVAFSAVVHIHP